MDEIDQYVQSFADALEKQFDEDSNEVEVLTEEPNLEAASPVRVVILKANLDSHSETTLRGLSLMVREFASQHGFNVFIEDDKNTRKFEMNLSPKIDFEKPIQNTAGTPTL